MYFCKYSIVLKQVFFWGGGEKLLKLFEFEECISYIGKLFLEWEGLHLLTILDSPLSRCNLLTRYLYFMLQNVSQ